MHAKHAKPVRWAERLFAAGFMLTLFALGVLLLLQPRTESTFSQQENRMLQGLPALTPESMLSGSFSGQFENYLLDNFLYRQQFTMLSRDMQSMLSVATVEDTVMATGDRADELAADISTLPPLTEESMEASEFAVMDVTLDTEPPGEDTALEALDIAPLPAESDEPAGTALAAAAPKPKYPSTVGIYYTAGGKKVAIRSYRAANVEHAAKVLNAYAACLPEGGRLSFIMVPSSSRMNKFILGKGASALTSDIETCLSANAAANVDAYSVADLLREPIARGEYVYFHTDMHWTPLGAHYAYEAMMRKLGREPVPYASYTVEREQPFLGTMYRDNPTSAMRRNPDTLDICQPYGAATLMEQTAPGKFVEIPIINMKAPHNDRYTVYLGGSQYAWSRITTEARTGRKALVVKDSFGLCFVPFLVPHYDEIHIVDPRYFNKRVAGGSVRELIKQYQIDDCFVIVGDLHAYNNSFLLSMVPRMLGK